MRRGFRDVMKAGQGMEQLKSVAILGVSGHLAQAVLKKLEHRPELERLIGVDVAPPQRHPAKLEYMAGDLRHAPLETLLKGADTLLHLAVAPLLLRHLGQVQQAQEALKRVVYAARAVGMKRVVVLTSGAAYGAHADNPMPIQEWRPLRPNPGNLLAEGWCAIEQTLESLRTEPDMPLLISMRSAVPMGPETPRERLQALTAEHVLLPLEPMAPIQLIHTEDLAEALLLALTRGERTLYHIAAAEPTTPRALFDAAQVRVVSLPRAMLEMLSEASHRMGQGRVLPDLLRLTRHPLLLSTVTIRHELQWEPRYTTLETFLETRRALRAQST